jgi:hypothetical protein
LLPLQLWLLLQHSLQILAASMGHRADGSCVMHPSYDILQLLL